MFEGRYGKTLTVILIIAIIVIVGILSFIGYEAIKKRNNDKDALAKIEEFDRVVAEKASPEPTDDPIEDIVNPDIEGGTSAIIGSNEVSSSGKKVTYKGYEMKGYIEIPKTKIQYPILSNVSKKSLETSVAILYPMNAKLNEPGNVVIVGHNYRNGMFFSNNKKLSAGDKIYITDEQGRKLTYVVYDNFEAAAEDTSFYTRDTAGVAEITLSTCTTDSAKRTIILAKVE